MYNEQLEQLIDAALADGVLTEKEKQVLFKKAQSMGIDLDEFEMVLDARLVKLQKAEQEKAASSAPKSNKFGDVKKCPACGAMVQSYQGVCPECGYAFEGIDANSAVKELSGLLQKASDQKQMERIIDNYPIPMEKASLMAFITWLRPQSTDNKNPLANSYFKKYAECVNKIKVSFSNDKQLQPFISLFETDEKKVKKQKIVNFIFSMLKNKWFYVGLAVIFVLFLIFKPKPISKDPERCNAAIIKAVDDGKLDKAYGYVISYKEDKDDIEQGIKALTMAYLKEDMIDQAELLASYAHNDEVEEALFEHFFSQGDLKKAEKYVDYDDDQGETKLFNAYLENRDYINAEKWAGTDDFYGGRSTNIERTIEAMCKNGDKAEAQRFLTRMKPKMKKDEETYSSKDGTKRYNERIKAIEKIISSY